MMKTITLLDKDGLTTVVRVTKIRAAYHVNEPAEAVMMLLDDEVQVKVTMKNADAAVAAIRNIRAVIDDEAQP